MKLPYTIPTRVGASIGRTFADQRLLLEGIRSGASLFRLPLGLADRDHARDLQAVRSAAASAAARNVEALADLPSSRPRVGEMRPRRFQPGDRVEIADAPAADAAEIIPLPGLAQIASGGLAEAVHAGDRVLFRDGRQAFRVLEAAGSVLKVECLQCAEPLQQGNGCTFPDSKFLFSALSENHLTILHGMAGADLKPDWIALSLIANAEQVRDARAVLKPIWKSPPRLMAKVETAEAVENLDDILAVSDGVLLGRGDLGCAMPPEVLPSVQAKVAHACAAAAKPWIVATQILEHYAAAGAVYRAELSDVALAGWQDAYAVLLCQETNDSPRPVESIALCRRILENSGGWRCALREE